MFYRWLPTRVHLVNCINVEFQFCQYDYCGFLRLCNIDVFAIYMTAMTCYNDPAQKHPCWVHPDVLFRFRIAKMQCPICKVVFTDVTSALLHPCPSVKPSDVYSGDWWWNKVTSQIEKDERERAAFAFRMHQNSIFYLASLVVGRSIASRGSTFIDIRTMDEFIASLDVSKEILLSQRSLK